MKILKFKDNIQLQNILLINDHRNKKLPITFSDIFIEGNEDYVETRATTDALTKLAPLPIYNQIRYGRKSIMSTSVAVWNRLSKHVFPEIDMSRLSRKRLKQIVTDHFLSIYALADV